MSKITITFDGLCAFFTGKLDDDPPELIVGLIDVSDITDAPETDYHSPALTIKSAGRLLKKYEGFVSEADAAYGLNNQGNFLGNISLDAPIGTPRIRKVMEGHGDHMEGHNLAPFDQFIMIDRDLFNGRDFNVNMDLCKAKLFIRNGLLYSLRKRNNLTFNDLKSDKTIPFERRTTMPGLEITIPDDSYAVLHFQSDAEDFVFKGGPDYQVALANNPVEADEQQHSQLAKHYKYFYNLIKPEERPNEVFVPEIAPEPTLGSPNCMPGGYGEP